MPPVFKKVYIARAKNKVWVHGRLFRQGSIALITRINGPSCEVIDPAQQDITVGDWNPMSDWEVIGPAVLEDRELGISGVAGNKRRPGTEIELELKLSGPRPTLYPSQAESNEPYEEPDEEDTGDCQDLDFLDLESEVLEDEF